MTSNTNYEVRYDDVKNPDGTVKIKVRFYYDGYAAVIAKPIPISLEDIEGVGSDEGNVELDKSECCYLNLTKWKIVDVPGHFSKVAKHLIGTELWLYYNGCERAWKFFDDDDDMYLDDVNTTREYLDLLYDESRNGCYEPHADDDGNFGDETMHAVYDINSLK